jgi:hypothetical protein
MKPMNPRDEDPEDLTATEPAKYVAFLEHWRTESGSPLGAPPRADPALLGWRPETAAAGEEQRAPMTGPPESTYGAGPTSGIRLPKRREAVESLRVRLAPEQLYWLHLAAARAGEKVDASLIVAAGLALLERLPIDWRAMRSRGDLALAIERALLPPVPEPEEGPVTPEWPGSRPADDR